MFHCLLVYIVFYRKSTFILIFVLQRSFFSLSQALSNVIIMCLDLIFLKTLSILNLWVYSFHQIDKIFSHYFFKNFLSNLFPSYLRKHQLCAYYTYIRPSEGVPHLSDATSFTFYSVYSLYFILDSFHCYVIKFWIFSSEVSNWLLIQSRVFFISDSIVFSSRISV